MGIGIPGSGKTTVLKEFAKRYEYSYICPDDIRTEITGSPSDQSKNREVWEEAYKRVFQNLNDGNTVVFDATFANKDQRKDFINFARENGAEKIQGVFFDVPIGLAKERNLERNRVVPEYAIDRMYRNLKQYSPELEDGFDGIFTLDEMGKMIDAEFDKEKNYKNEINKLI